MAHGRYTIIGKLADGGMAEIFLAMQHGAEGFQKPVVLKRVLTAFSADPQFRNMFLDEAQISMSLNHGNIVQVLDVGIAGERTFLVLELVEGWDLEQTMERAQATGPDHPWPPSLALYVTAQICRGLAYAHAKRGSDGRPLGIVHRDVSPNNVLVSEQGDVKLTDFGIAKAERKREQTLAGVIKGKIGFMSPEQALGRPLDARADLFSVGTVMYLMLTGRRPFDAGSELESMMLAQKAEYRPPEDLNPYLSPEATEIVKRAMQREPDQRYPTADQMLGDVERVLRSQYQSAGQTELKSWLAELSRRDGVPPMGLRALSSAAPDAEGEGQPVFVDEAGELSAGTSLELSDFDRPPPAAAATTAIAIQAPTPVGRTPRGSSGRPLREPTPRPVPLPAGAPFVTPARAGVTPSGVPTPLPSDSKSTPGKLRGSSSGSQSVDPTPAATPAVVAAAPSAAHRTLANIRLTRRSRVGLGFVLGALCMLGAVFGIRWLAAWAGRERIEISSWYPPASDPPPATAPPSPSPLSATGAGRDAPPAPGAPGTAPPAIPARTAAALSAAQPANGDSPAGAASGAHADGAAPTSPSGQAPVRAAPVAAPAATSPDQDEDETRLLGRVVPDAGGVVGSDEAEEAPLARTQSAKAKELAVKEAPAGGAPDARTADVQRPSVRQPRGSGARAPTATAARAQPVQIRITTSPLGAVVRTKKQVLGRTPLAVRFNPGNTYELTFVKSGYITKHRRLAVAAGKSHHISVAMKKAAPARRGFFRGR